MELNTKDLYWVAGILEGEGCFQADNGRYPRIRVGMTDRDVIEKLQSFIGGAFSTLEGYSRKDQYIFNIYGVKAIQWMMTLYCLMCARRKAKIKSIIDTWKISDYNQGRGKKISIETRKKLSLSIRLAHERKRLAKLSTNAFV